MKKLALIFLLTFCLALTACDNKPVDLPVDQSDPQEIVSIFEKIEKLSLGEGYGDDMFFLPNANEQSELLQLMRMDEWVVASDLPITGFSSEFYLQENEQTWFFNKYNDQTLIVPSSPDSNGEKVCYLAPKDVIPDVLAYAETLSVRPAPIIED